MRFAKKTILITIILLSSVGLLAQSPGWTVNPAEYDFNGEVNARIYFGTDLATTGTLGAFVGSTCRGYATGAVFSLTGQTIFSVMCFSNVESGETMTFRYYNASDGVTYNVDETITFTSDMIQGTASVPLDFHIYLSRTLNLTGVLLEGLYNGSGTMREAWNDTGPQWGSGVADHITVELHNSSNYSSIVHTATYVVLTTAGTATVSIPYIYSGSYYITIKHRNSIETTTSLPVSFSSLVVSYSLNLPSKVFGGNIKLIDVAGNHYCIFGSDSNNDGVVDGLDLINVENAATLFSTGYVPNDLNGDGVVDALDLIMVENNALNFVSVILP
jgi:hypothetical protein